MGIRVVVWPFFTIFKEKMAIILGEVEWCKIVKEVGKGRL